MKNTQSRGSPLGLEHRPAPRATSETQAFAVRWPCRRQAEFNQVSLGMWVVNAE